MGNSGTGSRKAVDMMVDVPSYRRDLFQEIDLPPGSAIVALVRDDKVIIAHHDTVIETDDHVIIFLTDRRKIDRIEQLFQVGVSFV